MAEFDAGEACSGRPVSGAASPVACPSNGRTGRGVGPITLKALLPPQALATLDPDSPPRYCPDPACDTVYQDEQGREYRRADVEVPVLAKEPPDAVVPVCYCFGWTRSRVRQVGRAVLAEIGATSALAAAGAR